MYWNKLGYCGICRDVLGCTWICWDVSGQAAICWDVLGCAALCLAAGEALGHMHVSISTGTCPCLESTHHWYMSITGTCPSPVPAHHLDLPTSSTCPSLALGKGDEQQFVRVPSVWKLLRHCHTQCMKHCKSKLNYFQSHALRFAVNSSEDS